MIIKTNSTNALRWFADGYGDCAVAEFGRMRPCSEDVTSARCCDRLLGLVRTVRSEVDFAVVVNQADADAVQPAGSSENVLVDRRVLEEINDRTR